MAGPSSPYRLIDFRRDKVGIPGKVSTIEYDPNRTARIALVVYPRWREAVYPGAAGLKVGDKVESGAKAEARTGESAIKNIPVGTFHPQCGVEAGPGRTSWCARRARRAVDTQGSVYAQVRLPSGEVRLVDQLCTASIGQLGNVDQENRSLGKAGKSRVMGIRPSVRGSAMTPRDPHGGGEGQGAHWASGSQDPLGQACSGIQDPQ